MAGTAPKTMTAAIKTAITASHLFFILIFWSSLVRILSLNRGYYL